jgi:hypothetical protein
MTEQELSKMISEFLPYPAEGQHHALKQFAKLVAAAEREKVKHELLTLEKWKGMALAKDGDGRTVQEVEREARETVRVYCSCGDGIVPDDGALCGICVSLKKMREWQGLTDEEKNEITWGKTVYEILDLAEAKLKEKNA